MFNLSRYIAFLLLLLVGCVKPFDYGSVDYERAIVVDGLFTDKKDKHKVFLGYTYPINTFETTPISGAQIMVMDSKGNEYPFVETISGAYTTIDSVAGISGETYQLMITLEDGSSYESRPTLLMASQPIDSIYDRYAHLPSETKGRNEGGIQFFLDVHDDSNQNRHFRFEWEETFVIYVPYPSNYIYYEESDTWEYRTERVGTCYTTNYSNQLILGNSIGSSTNRLAEFPIRFVSEESTTLRHRYSILVRQYVLDEYAYNYYRKVRESIESGGSLFDKQQGTITGNISSINNPGEMVLGYFEVSGTNETRVFFDAEELDEEVKRPPYPYPCTNELIITVNDSVAYYYQQGYYIVNDTQIPFEPNMEMAPQLCTECASYASTVRPEFWID